MAVKSAPEIARETLKRLMELGLPPTPELYARHYYEFSGEPAPTDRPWPSLMRRFFKEWERSQAGLSHLQKMLSRNQLLEEQDAQALAIKLERIIQQWEKLPTRQADSLADVSTETAPTAENCADWRRFALSGFQYASKHDNESLDTLLQQMQVLLKQEETTPDLILPLAQKFWRQLDLLDDKEKNICQGLQELLQLLLRNVADLLDNDQYLSGQMDVVQRAVSEAQSRQELEKAIASIKDVIFQQGKLKSEAREAREAIRDLVNLVLASVENLAGANDRNHQHLEHLAGELQDAKDWQQIRQIVNTVVATSKVLASQSMDAKVSLTQAKNRLQAAQTKIRKLEEKMEAVSQLVHVDPLTGVLNRRGLTSAFAREAARATRLNQPLSVAIVDLDHFKQVNDKYGHDLGDLVLQGMAKILQETLRANDVITRYGGEEFVILMPDTGPEKALIILERVQDRLGSHPFQTRDQALKVTFSGGISLWQSTWTQEQGIAAADTAMYRAKRAGRQCIYLADNHANSSN